MTRGYWEKVFTWNVQRFTGKRSLPGMTRGYWEKVFTWNVQRMVGGGTPFARQDRLTISPSSATALLADASRLGGTRTFT